MTQNATITIHPVCRNNILLDKVFQQRFCCAEGIADVKDSTEARFNLEVTWIMSQPGMLYNNIIWRILIY